VTFKIILYLQALFTCNFSYICAAAVDKISIDLEHRMAPLRQLSLLSYMVPYWQPSAF